MPGRRSSLDTNQDEISEDFEDSESDSSIEARAMPGGFSDSFFGTSLQNKPTADELLKLASEEAMEGYKNIENEFKKLTVMKNPFQFGPPAEEFDKLQKRINYLDKIEKKNKPKPKKEEPEDPHRESSAFTK
jgi:hypothetical protein